MISTIISVISVIVAAVALISNLIDRYKKNSLELIQYRLDELDKNLQKVLDKLDRYDTEIDEKIDKKMAAHVAVYHEKRGEL